MKNEAINIEKEYRESVIKIWEKYGNINELNEPNCEYRKYPILPRTIKKDSILFIGINPSFGKGGVIDDKEKPLFFYDLSNQNEKDISYFEKFKEVARYCNNADWSHLDLFFIRETKQDLIERMSHNNIPFLNAQLEISFDIIKKAEPKVIVVANALASEFFGKMKSRHWTFSEIWQGYDFFFEKGERRDKQSNFDSTIGTYRIKLTNKQVPIIFSGMLSGQRALDIGSLERLKWQIKMIIDSKTVV